MLSSSWPPEPTLRLASIRAALFGSFASAMVVCRCPRACCSFCESGLNGLNKGTEGRLTNQRITCLCFDCMRVTSCEYDPEVAQLRQKVSRRVRSWTYSPTTIKSQGRITLPGGVKPQAKSSKAWRARLPIIPSPRAPVSKTRIRRTSRPHQKGIHQIVIKCIKITTIPSCLTRFATL